MNLPNLLTLSRIGFAAVIVYLLLLNSLTGNVWAAVLFVVASITDFYDGYFAKKMNLISDFGKLMDPIADKVLLLSIFFVLAHIGIVTWWMVILIGLREFFVTVDRLLLMSKGQVVAAERLGKIKTVVQILTISMIFVYLILDQGAYSSGWFQRIREGYLRCISVFMVTTVYITLYSGYSYWQGRNRNKSV